MQTCVVIAWVAGAEKLKTKSIALGAMYSAFSVLLLTLSVTFGDDMFFLMLSSLLIAFVTDHLGYKTGIISYFTVLTLSFAFFALRPAVIEFAVIFGPYTLIRSFVSKRTLSNIILRWLTLVALSLVAYEILKVFVGIQENYLKVVTIVLAAVALFLYERLVEFSLRWHRRFIKRISGTER